MSDTKRCRMDEENDEGKAAALRAGVTACEDARLVYQARLDEKHQAIREADRDVKAVREKYEEHLKGIEKLLREMTGIHAVRAIFLDGYDLVQGSQLLGLYTSLAKAVQHCPTHETHWLSGGNYGYACLFTVYPANPATIRGEDLEELPIDAPCTTPRIPAILIRTPCHTHTR